MEDGPAVDDIAPAQPPPPNEVMGAFMDALNRIQRHNQEIEFLRTASGAAKVLGTLTPRLGGQPDQSGDKGNADDTSMSWT